MIFKKSFIVMGLLSSLFLLSGCGPTILVSSNQSGSTTVTPVIKSDSTTLSPLNKDRVRIGQTIFLEGSIEDSDKIALSFPLTTQRFEELADFTPFPKNQDTQEFFDEHGTRAKFQIEEESPGFFIGRMFFPDTPGVYGVKLHEVDNSLPEQQKMGGRYVRDSSASIDLLFLGPSKVRIQGLAAWPELPSEKNPSPNVWPVGMMGLYEPQANGTGTIQVGEGVCGWKIVLSKDGSLSVQTTSQSAEAKECGGNNTTFDGAYRRETTRIPNWSIYEDILGI